MIILYCLYSFEDSHLRITSIHIRFLTRISSGSAMRLIAVHLPEQILDDIDQLVNKGTYPSRSETIRIAIRDLLKREL